MEKYGGYGNGNDWQARRSHRVQLAERMEEFFNKSHAQSGPQGGQFVEGPDGPGRKRDPGTEDLGKKGNNEKKTEAADKASGDSDSDSDNSLDKRASNVVKLLVGKTPEEHDAAKAKAVEDRAANRAHTRSGDIKVDAEYKGISGKVKKALDGKKFEADIERLTERIEYDKRNYDMAAAGMGGSGPQKRELEESTKMLAEVEERYKKWRTANGD